MRGSLQRGGPMQSSERYRLAIELGLASGKGRGLVERDENTHAIALGVDGPESRCGAGPILRELPGQFENSDLLACPHCVALQLADFGL